MPSDRITLCVTKYCSCHQLNFSYIYVYTSAGPHAACVNYINIKELTKSLHVLHLHRVVTF
jgi:hypothetical protein